MRAVQSVDEPTPAGFEVIDLTGRYVLPGLINSHVHFTPLLGRDPHGADAELRRMLHGGVTTVRDAAGDARKLRTLRAAVASGETPGPDIYFAATVASPDFMRNDMRATRASEGFTPGTAPWQQEVTDASDARAVALRAAETGASGIKFYVGVGAETIAAIVAEAHARGLRTWAHATVFPDRPIDVVRAGVEVVSHLCSLVWQDADLDPETNVPYTNTPANDPRPKFDPGRVDANSPEMTALFSEMSARGVLLDATHSLYRFEPPARAERPGGTVRQPMPDGCRPDLMTALARAARGAGVEFVTGTDGFAPAEFEHPSLLMEIEQLVGQDVLTPLEAITAATRNGARALGIEATHGTVTAGKAADLVVADADPSRDVRALRGVVLVLKGGVVYRRSDDGR